jgi:DNA-binding transcriptional ArsR family regulator
VTSTERTKISDPAVMRALAHPARLLLLEYLSLNLDGATATECATVVGLTPSATSYHLRALAKVGMIKDAPGRGDGRERVWQASYRNYSMGLDRDAAANDADLAAETALVEAVLARQNEKVRRYVVGSRKEPAEWYALGTITDQTLAVTARELTKLLKQIDELTEPLKRLNRERPPKGARIVSFQIRAVPTDS